MRNREILLRILAAFGSYLMIWIGAYSSYKLWGQWCFTPVMLTEFGIGCGLLIFSIKE